ncbi:hypothetical protein [uncultured Devosia sp.]|uniref:hypothetical protein n=1 Tax=uncultured Devosia sp. TaxID=211434 RepID=UPI0035C9D8AA
MNEDATAPLVAAPDWSVIRVEYESRAFLPRDICRRYAVTDSQLRYRREKEGWTGSRARVVRSSDLINRMFKILNKQVRLLENAVKDPIEKQVGALSTTVKTFEKLVELSATERNVQPTNKKDMRDLRDKLARRLDQFKQR